MDILEFGNEQCSFVNVCPYQNNHLTKVYKCRDYETTAYLKIPTKFLDDSRIFCFNNRQFLYE